MRMSPDIVLSKLLYMYALLNLNDNLCNHKQIFAKIQLLQLNFALSFVGNSITEQTRSQNFSAIAKKSLNFSHAENFYKIVILACGAPTKYQLLSKSDTFSYFSRIYCIELFGLCPHQHSITIEARYNCTTKLGNNS